MECEYRNHYANCSSPLTASLFDCQSKKHRISDISVKLHETQHDQHCGSICLAAAVIYNQESIKSYGQDDFMQLHKTSLYYHYYSSLLAAVQLQVLVSQSQALSSSCAHTKYCHL